MFGVTCLLCRVVVVAGVLHYNPLRHKETPDKVPDRTPPNKETRTRRPIGYTRNTPPTTQGDATRALLIVQYNNQNEIVDRRLPDFVKVVEMVNNLLPNLKRKVDQQKQVEQGRPNQTGWTKPGSNEVDQSRSNEFTYAHNCASRNGDPP
jgi:hypothetical protein